jgi:DivIVA domain-containing protein
MPDFLLLVVVALVVAALVFGVGALLTGADPGLVPAEPEGGSRGLPTHRPLVEADFVVARFDTALRGYRMSQVDAAIARAAYDIGFKQEMIETLRAEMAALREGRTEDAEMLRKARESAAGDAPDTTGRSGAAPPEPVRQAETTDRAEPAGSSVPAESSVPAGQIEPEQRPG